MACYTSDFYKTNQKFEHCIESLQAAAKTSMIETKDKQKEALEVLCEHIEEVKLEQLAILETAYEQKFLPGLLKLAKELNLAKELEEFFKTEIFYHCKDCIDDEIRSFRKEKALCLGLE